MICITGVNIITHLHAPEHQNHSDVHSYLIPDSIITGKPLQTSCSAIFFSQLICVCVIVQVLGVCSREYIPKGTRFGPLVGEIYTADSVPKDANRKYFWRVSAKARAQKHTHTSAEAGETLSCDVTRI